MTRNVAYGLLGIAAFAVFALASAPARLALPYIAGDLPPFARIAGVRGSIWAGHLALVMRAATEATPLSRVRFRFAPLPLFRGEVGYELHFSGVVKGHMQAAFASSATEIAHVHMTMPAGILAALVPAARSFGPGGSLVLQAADLVWGRHPSGQGTLTWRDATLVSAPVNPLGTYAAHFVLTPAAVSYRIHTTTGKLHIVGRGRYLLGSGVLSFAGDVRGQGLRLAGLVQNFGAPDGRRGRRVRFRTRL